MELRRRTYQLHPSIYPTGWFQVAYGDDLETGEAIPLMCLGREMVLFRAEDGTPRLLGGLCPHLGAHLGHGGEVEGDSIRCPLHGWRFDGEGRCVEVPNSPEASDSSSVECWPLIERNGMILMWHDGAKSPPRWDVPELFDVDGDTWLPRHRGSWRVPVPKPEAADRALLVALHHLAQANPEPFETNADTHRLTTRVRLKAPGDAQGSAEACVTQHGLGVSATRYLGASESLCVTAVTSVDEDALDVRVVFATRDAREARGDVRRQLREAKTAPLAPARRNLGVIGSHGQTRATWAGQFYPPSVVER